MNMSERFSAIMEYRPFDRLPVWYFGAWNETIERWKTEGLSDWSQVAAATGMDADWEMGMWQGHELVRLGLLPESTRQVIEDHDDWQLMREPNGAIMRISKTSESIPLHVEEALKPTREAWNEFKKRLDPHSPGRIQEDWGAKAKDLNARDAANCFFGGSLFGRVRGWMGVEQLSYLSYDDPSLYEEIVEQMTDFFIETYRPVLPHVRADFVYLFEDCCGRTGPLLSPDSYRKYYHKHYKRLVEFYHSCGVKHVMLDSDGYIEPLIPCWLESGIDILFPIEVGTWKASPVDLRRKFGRQLRMIGGVDKHVIVRGEPEIRAELSSLRELAAEGGYIPLPDHRIPPDCSVEQFRTYVRVFKEVFADLGC